MSWRSTVRRTRQRPRTNLPNRDIWSGDTQIKSDMGGADQIGMHVRVLRYHEIRLGNIEKQLASISRQLNNLGRNNNVTKTNPVNVNAKRSNKVSKNNSNETVSQLQNVLQNLAQEVASSNKMIKQFITGDSVEFKKEKPETVEVVKEVPKVDERETMEWKLAKARLVRCGIRATDERIRDMVKTMKEEIDLVTDILDNHTNNLEKSVEKAVEETIIVEAQQEKQEEQAVVVEETVNSEKNSHNANQNKSDNESESESENGEEETIDISTTNDIGYVPVHVVVKKKRGRPKKKKTSAP